MLEIKVLGPGCANCQKLESKIRAVLDEKTIEYKLTKVTDYGEIASHGVISTPAMVINEQVISSGRIPSDAHILDAARAQLEK